MKRVLDVELEITTELSPLELASSERHFAEEQTEFKIDR